MPDAEADDRDAEGHTRGHRPRDPGRRGTAYGYEITAWLRDQGFSDIAEGTIYALLVRVEQRGLVDVEKVPSEKGPPRKVYSLNAQGRDQLAEFWRTWSFLAERIEQLRTRRRSREHGREVDRAGHRVARGEEAVTGSTRRG